MEILLRREVENLGKPGDTVKVANGYARNYLLPKGIAVTVSKRNLELVEHERQRAIVESEAIGKERQGVAEKLAQASVTIAEKSSPEGHLYGSVGAQQIADALKKEGFDGIDAKMIVLEEPIKELNVYDITVQLQPGIDATCKVWVVADAEE